ncbi:MAG: SAM-dependent methyltransferase [Clostridia bacterium]|nr:SAM-dependent methyltransferase [Clostridia bacterium]
MIHLTPRQQMAADLIREGRPLADIGTDHAHLPVALLQQKRIPFAWCCDVNEGPLQNAKSTIHRCRLTAQTQLVLSDGFAALTPEALSSASAGQPKPGFYLPLTENAPNECHDYVVAGMGGVLTLTLLQEAPWLKDPRNHFVLQPQSRYELVREYLFSNGYEILRETAALDHHRPYTAFEVIYTGKVNPFTPSDCYLGKMAELPDPELKNRYLTSLSHYLEDQIRGLHQMESTPERIAEREKLEPVLRDVRNLLERS